MPKVDLEKQYSPSIQEQLEMVFDVQRQLLDHLGLTVAFVESDGDKFSIELVKRPPSANKTQTKGEYDA